MLRARERERTQAQDRRLGFLMVDVLKQRRERRKRGRHFLGVEIRPRDGGEGVRGPAREVLQGQRHRERRRFIRVRGQSDLHPER